MRSCDTRTRSYLSYYHKGGHTYSASDWLVYCLDCLALGMRFRQLVGVLIKIIVKASQRQISAGHNFTIEVLYICEATSAIKCYLMRIQQCSIKSVLHKRKYNMF